MIFRFCICKTYFPITNVCFLSTFGDRDWFVCWNQLKRVTGSKDDMISNFFAVVFIVAVVSS